MAAPPSVDAAPSVSVLGPLLLTVTGREVAVPGLRERALLALLASEVTRAVPVTRLYAFLWGDDPPRTADKTLQTYVSRLRRLLGDVPDVLVRQGAAYALQLPREHVDTVRFDRDRQTGSQALRRRDAVTALAAFEAAVSHWRSDEPAEVGTTPTAAAWRRAWVEARHVAVEGLARARLLGGQWERAVSGLEQEVVRSPERETLWMLLMEAYASDGQRAAALDAFHRARSFARDELGLDPSPALAALHGRILRSDFRPATATAEVASQRPSALIQPQPPPATLAPMVGRASELQAVAEAMERGRLVTITGTGGVGKTRLAVEIAQRSSEVAWCELASLPPEGRIDRALLSALGLVAGQADDPLSTAIDLIGGSRLLLVLDNVEHVIAPVRPAVLRLLATCPRLRLLVTSRRPLRVAGEQVVGLRPLSTGSAGTAEACLRAAVRRAGGPPLEEDQDELVTAVCQRLDGLPLALELAAPVVHRLGLAAVRDGLADRFALLDVAWDATGRERDLAGTVGWSEALLAPRLRGLFRTLSVFAGPFDADAAAAVASWQGQVGPELAALVDRCLVEAVGGDPPRFRLLETVRAYGRRALGGAAYGASRDRHAAWVAGLADQIKDRILSADEARLTRSLDDHLDEFDAAIRWTCEQGDVDTALRIAVGLGPPMLLGVRRDLALWIEDVLEVAADAEHPLLGEAWGFVALWRLTSGDHRGAAAASEAGVRAARVCGVPLPFSVRYYQLEERLRAYDLDGAREVASMASNDHVPEAQLLVLESSIMPLEFSMGLVEAAQERAERLLPRIEANGSYTLRALGSLSVQGRNLDRPAAALPAMREALALAREARSRAAENIILMVIGAVAVRAGDDRMAARTFLDSLGAWGSQGSWRYEWNTIREVMELLARRGHHEPLLVLTAAAATSVHAPELLGEQSEVLGEAVAAARTTLGSAASSDAERRGAALSDAQAVAYTRDVLAPLAA